MSQPDLFVVCKNCGSEVSPYVTECPYCGQRVRKRAPKLDRSSGEPEQKRRKRSRKLPRLRAEEIAGIAPDTRPYATFGLIAACVAGMLLYAASPGMDFGYLGIVRDAPSLSDNEVWRWFTTPFLHGDQLGYAFVALVAVGIFGTLLERRFGPVAVVATFILAGAAGAGLSVLLETPPLLSDTPVWAVIGANGAALGVLVAWLVEDRLAARGGNDRENDLIGVYVIAAVLVLLSLTTEEANISAAVGGALVGAVMGLLLPEDHPEGLMFSDEQVEAAVRALSDPERFADAERLVTAAAPQLHRVLAHALNQGGWFGPAHESELRSAVAEPDEVTRVTRVETLLAEETRLGMMVGVAVGWELARELGNTNEPGGD